ncbi:MAG TPA: chemotaxis protein CheB [Thermoanaerobaculia bacterium]|nr:chemotaxis protein CheB [Thermoanaerobaculia bacterium]
MAKRTKALPQGPRRKSAGKKPAAAPDQTRGMPLRVAGIGASAGGLDAFRELLEHLRADSGMAFVIVQHLARNQKSMLPDILSRSTAMPVAELAEATTILANHVYVMPSDADVEYAHDALVLRKRESGAKHRPVDRLFASLAEGLGHRAIGVILSGTDGDGAAGAQQIKAVGGVTFAQDASAQFGGMPHTAIEKGVVDFVLPPKEIAHKLVELAERPAAALDDLPALPVRELDRIIELLNATERIDFLHYKTPTIERRIQRRMLLRNIGDLGEYRGQLEKDDAEREALYRDLLIGVTRFFRDPSRTATLKQQVFPSLVAESSEEPLRFWVPGCSTGEEVYSLAILLVEYLAEKELSRSIQIFGSDVNEESVAFARAGFYPQSIETAVSPERLRRFFTPSAGGGYSIGRSIRELCVFAEHNLLKDPPFSRLDLISCNNLLIYLKPAQQERLVATFRYALNPKGLLLLGPSESLRPSADGFVVVDKKHKIYRAASGARPRLEIPLGVAKRADVLPAGPFTANAAEDPARAIDRLLLERYAHPALVLNDANEVIEFRGDVQPFLAHAAGAPSFKLSNLLHPDLLLDVRTALFKARHSREPVRCERLKLTRGKETRFVTVEVLPAAHPVHERIYAVTFEAMASPVGEEATNRKSRRAGTETERLQQELAAARGYLAHLTSAHEQSDSVLHVTAEELQSANEELQSTIEELETAKEELQSTNEELSTLNDELRVRNADLMVLGDDLMNLLSSIDTPVIMVDRDLVLRVFNPTAERLFHFRQSDVGRSISAFKPLMELPDLPEVLRRVIDTQTAVDDNDIQSREGHWYSLRVRPYRSSRDQVAGAVITLVDTHTLRTALLTAEESRDLAEKARSNAERARFEASEANRLKDEFLSTLSHELRTPMTSILGWAQMMRMATLDPDTMSTAVETIERGTYAQIRLIDDLLDISRITTGRLRLEQRPFRLRALIEETLDVVRPAIEAKKIEVKTNLAEAPAMVYGDPDRLRQVIWNLLSNAVKFTHAEGTIEVTALVRDGAAVFCVKDSGEGIDPGFLPHVFERFSQAEGGSRRTKSGLGLGLAISKYVVDLHGGAIFAESRGMGRGATFTVTLPIVTAAMGQAAAGVLLAGSPGDLPALNGTTVLVVDDDGDSLKLVATALEHCGASVIAVESVQAAMDELQSAKPDLIVTDIAMPSEDGVDLLRRVRSLRGSRKSIPMIALTAYTSDDDRRRILDAGFAEHIAKPVAPLTLLGVVAAVANGR